MYREPALQASHYARGQRPTQTPQNIGYLKVYAATSSHDTVMPRGIRHSSAVSGLHLRPESLPYHLGEYRCFAIKDSSDFLKITFHRIYKVCYR